MATITTFDGLEEVGGIVSRKPFKKNIKWTAVDPETGDETEHDADILLLKQGSGVLADIWGKKEPEHEEIALWISKSMMMLNKKGTLELISYENAYMLDAPLRGAVWKEIRILAGLEKKALPLSTSSSASSSVEESAAEPSKKPESA